MTSGQSQITSSRSLMHSSKKAGPRMEPWGTLTLTGYYCEDFPSRATWSNLLLRKEELRPNIWPELPKDLRLWRRPACQTLSKALEISSATAQVVPDLLKALAYLPDTTVWRSAIDLEDLKTYWQSQKRPHFSWWSTTIIYKFFKDVTNHRKKRLTGFKFLEVNLSPQFLNTGTINENFQ